MCTSLAAVDFPESLVSIGESAFDGCSSLVSVDFPESLTDIGMQAFYGCISLVSVDLPDGLTSISDGAFYYCTSLASVDFPKSLTKIGMEAFRSCRSLASVDFPESLTEIGGYAFFECGSLASVNFPESLTEIEGYAFFECGSLASVALPDGLTYMGDLAFGYCSNLASVVVLSSGPLSVDYKPFIGCDSMKEVFLFSHDAIAYMYDAPLFGSFDYTVYSFSDQDLPNWLAPAAAVRLSLGGLEERMVYTGVVPDVYIAGNTSSYGMSLDKNSINFDVNAGGHVIDGFSFWLSCEDKDYYVTISDSVDYVIDKAPLTVSAESCETTYGDPLLETFEFMVSYDGFVNGEDETVLSSMPQAMCDAGPILSTVRMRLCFQACLRQCAMPVPIPMQAYIP